jgi:hypothetical protein
MDIAELHGDEPFADHRFEGAAWNLPRRFLLVANFHSTAFKSFSGV